MATPDSTTERVTHTPAPWKSRGTDVYGAGSLVASAPSKLTASGSTVAHIHASANARLIAAAPDLLEACKAARLYDAAIEKRGMFWSGLEQAGDGLPGAITKGADLDVLYLDWQTKADAAIRKAEGGL